ncbi:DUF4229 domain-containing protein [Leucobacter insecticola]|uniref:DUF4229 domain-containing protein n=1 Tax=Leucobacter insecticola TaxID=2714934 RepID=A0A6G8FHI3_9MICO|nr:DUF4229 domain-containing protein [Leucobacter insecticola]QIM15739.1 DUF4229 domain-containing protein [Leucobacter insecticola]
MKNPRTAWLVYTALRLLFFAVPFAVLMLLGIWPWLSAIFAGLIGVSLSIIFLSKPRAVASESIYDWRNRERTADDIVEDEAIEAEVEAEAEMKAEAAAEATDAAATEAEPAVLAQDPADGTPQEESDTWKPA